jgi:hypothetical protein
VFVVDLPKMSQRIAEANELLQVRDIFVGQQLLGAATA